MLEPKKRDGSCGRGGVEGFGFDGRDGGGGDIGLANSTCDDTKWFLFQIAET